MAPDPVSITSICSPRVSDLPVRIGREGVTTVDLHTTILDIRSRHVEGVCVMFRRHIPQREGGATVAKHTKKSLVLSHESCCGPSIPCRVMPANNSFSPCRDAPKDAADIATQRLGINLQTCCSLLGWCLLSKALLLLAPSSSQFSHITEGSELSMGRSTAAHVVNVSIKSLPTRRMPSPNLYLFNQQTFFRESRKKKMKTAHLTICE